jgi:hypothetical protein
MSFGYWRVSASDSFAILTNRGVSGFTLAMQMAEYINSSPVIFKCAMFMYGDLIRRISSGHPPKKHSNRAIIHLSDMTPEAVQFFSFRI